MPRIPLNDFRKLIQQVNTAVTTPEKGRALEKLIAFLFAVVPGVEIVACNTLNAFGTEEVDVALWNNKDVLGFHFLPDIILVECKNWTHPCGSQEVAYFISRLRQRGCNHGILIASSGITGVPEEITRAHFQIATALTNGVRVIVITLQELLQLTNSDELVTLLKKKLCQLVVSGTNFD